MTTKRRQMAIIYYLSIFLLTQNPMLMMLKAAVYANFVWLIRLLAFLYVRHEQQLQRAHFPNLFIKRVLSDASQFQLCQQAFDLHHWYTYLIRYYCYLWMKLVVVIAVTVAVPLYTVHIALALNTSLWSW